MLQSGLKQKDESNKPGSNKASNMLMEQKRKIIIMILEKIKQLINRENETL